MEKTENSLYYLVAKVSPMNGKKSMNNSKYVFNAVLVSYLRFLWQHWVAVPIWQTIKFPRLLAFCKMLIHTVGAVWSSFEPIVSNLDPAL